MNRGAKLNMDNMEFLNIKEQLINDLNRRVGDQIIEQATADFLIKLINKADTIDEALTIAEMGTKYKRTGFSFTVQKEKITEVIKYFNKDEKLSFTDGSDKPHHLLISGDNYPVLQNLLIEYTGKVDVIYIDPPYGKDSMGEFAATNYNNSISRDNLLSMLYPRLQLAKQLLSEEGIIYCSIDYKNQAYIKCLFDDIFGENNYVSCISCNSNPGGDKGEFIETTLQYVLVYAKDKTKISPLGYFEKCDSSQYNLRDDFGLYKKGGQLEKWGNDDTTHTHPNLAYSIYYQPNTKDVKYLFDYNLEEITNNRALNIKYEEPNQDLIKKGYVCIRPRITNQGENGRWRLEANTFFERLKNKDFIFEETSDETYKIYEKDRFQETKFVKAKDFLDVKLSKQNSKELLAIFNDKKMFDYPKPVALIQFLIKIAPKSNIVLDFFAGSGTTGNAVLEQNKIDGINRQFILVQLNEKIIESPKKANPVVLNQINLLNEYGLPLELQYITYDRLKRIMTGSSYKNKYNGFAWLKDNDPFGGSLDVYEVAEVSDHELEEGKTPFDVINETLYGLPKFTSNKEKIKWVCEHFEMCTKKLEGDNNA